MKRSPELTPLSHDHHQALFVALQLKRAEDPSPADLFISFLADDGEEHFRMEESILLPAWFAGGRADDAMAERVLSDHLELRAAAQRLRDGERSVDDLHSIGELLEQHVRFEERLLFPRIESDLDAESIAALGARLAAAESRPAAT